jgi:hypothetical protein
MRTRFAAAKVALLATVLLALALVAMELLDAPWLGFAALALLCGVLVAREITIVGGRGFLLFSAVTIGVIAVAFVVQRLS